jgi:hypothetical protein
MGMLENSDDQIPLEAEEVLDEQPMRAPGLSGIPSTSPRPLTPRSPGKADATEASDIVVLPIFALF